MFVRVAMIVVAATLAIAVVPASADIPPPDRQGEVPMPTPRPDPAPKPEPGPPPLPPKPAPQSEPQAGARGPGRAPGLGYFRQALVSSRIAG